MANCTPSAAPLDLGRKRLYALDRLVADFDSSHGRDIYGSTQPPYPELAGAPFHACRNLRLRLVSRLERDRAKPFRTCTGRIAFWHPLLVGRHGNGRSEVVCCHWRLDWADAAAVCSRNSKHGRGRYGSL